MRFLPHEHADLTATLNRHGVHPVTVLFVKRRGRLHVEVPGHSPAFAFFRAKSTKLGDDGQWQERVQYFIGPGKSEPCDWPDVLHAFERWLT
ncbi:MAG: hypothetical protein JNM62_03710 [Flavobacteriales bacterium]|nr:hypothetical protein [Flavobacteriales bacterium]